MKQSEKEFLEKIKDRLRGVPIDRIRTVDLPRPSKDIIERYAKIEDLTSNVSDILDNKGIQAAIPASVLQPVIPGKVVVGPAITLRHIPERKVPLQKWNDGEPELLTDSDAGEVAQPGDVLVFDGYGRADTSSQGGQLTLFLKQKGVAGTIIDGGSRDIGSIRKLDYPLWARGFTPITGKQRFHGYEINCPINCAGVVVYPGDLVAADDSGIVFIPSDLIGEVLSILEEIDKKEAIQREKILGGGKSFKEVISESATTFK